MEELLKLKEQFDSDMNRIASSIDKAIEELKQARIEIFGY